MYVFSDGTIAIFQINSVPMHLSITNVFASTCNYTYIKINTIRYVEIFLINRCTIAYYYGIAFLVTYVT